MAKPTLEEARRAAILEGVVKVRLLLRNSKFQEDLKEVRRHENEKDSSECKASASMIKEALDEPALDPNNLGTLTVKFPNTGREPVTRLTDLKQKYGLQWLPYDLIQKDGTIADHEKILLETLQEDPHAQKQPPWRPAVIAVEPFDEWYEKACKDWDGTEQTIEPPKDIPPPGTILNITVDLSYPQTVIEAEIKTALQKAKERREKLTEHGHLPTRPTRLHLEKLDLQLKVYDLAKEGRTFKEIAEGLASHPSTVKSALLAASRKIRAVSLTAKPEVATSKKELPLADCDADGHVANCVQCGTATSIDDMCDLAKRFILQDHVSQRELPASDWVEHTDEPDAEDAL